MRYFKAVFIFLGVFLLPISAFAEEPSKRILFIIEASTGTMPLSLDEVIDGLVSSPWSPIQNDDNVQFFHPDANAVVLTNNSAVELLAGDYDQQQSASSMLQLFSLTLNLLAKTEDGIGFLVINENLANQGVEYCSFYQDIMRYSTDTTFAVIGYQLADVFHEVDLRCLAHNLKGYYYQTRDIESLGSIVLTTIESLTFVNPGDYFDATIF